MSYIAFSYSRINDFELCPRAFHEVAIKKSVRKETTPQMEEGKRVHKKLEVRVRDGVALPTDLTHLEPLTKALAGTRGTKRCEFQMAINGNFEPVDWFARDVYSRAIADLVIDNGAKAALFDYKTGKKKDDKLQLKMTAVHYFQYAPLVEEIRCAFIWTQDGSATPVTVTRAEIPEVWSEMAPRIEKYQQAFRDKDFPPKPSWACRRCPVKTCQYNEAK